MNNIFQGLRCKVYSPYIMSVQYIGGCSVHWGISMSAPGGVQYTGGYHEYTGECSVDRGYHGYSGRCAVYWGITMSTLEGYHDECGGYHEYTGGCSVHWGFHTNSTVFATPT